MYTRDIHAGNDGQIFLKNFATTNDKCFIYIGLFRLFYGSFHRLYDKYSLRLKISVSGDHDIHTAAKHFTKGFKRLPAHYYGHPPSRILEELQIVRETPGQSVFTADDII